MTSEDSSPPANGGPETESGAENLDTRSKKASILGAELTRKSITWTAAGVVVAIIAIVVTVITSGGGPQTTQTSGSGSNINVDGDGNVTFQGLDEFLKRLPAGAPADQYRKEAAAFAQTPPQGSKPWAFVVVADPTLGLKVRSSGDREGTQIGSAGFGTAVWVDCKKDTGFNAGEGSGSVWFRIGWPNTAPTAEFYNSSPGDPPQGWVYNGFAVPAGHNGQVPDCT